MMEFPGHEEYVKLYARYQRRPVQEMLDIAGSVEDKVVWDLCAGGGELSLACLKAGASHVMAVDICHAMMQPLLEYKKKKRRRSSRLLPNSCPIEWVCGKPLPDVVFCRQGVNYWFNKDSAFRVASSMRPGTVFVFNTFNTRPPTKPLVKEYDYEGHHFVETSWRVDKIVHHVQVREGMESHWTFFRWIPRGEFKRTLRKFFEIEETIDGRTSFYRCVRNDTLF